MPVPEAQVGSAGEAEARLCLQSLGFLGLSGRCQGGVRSGGHVGIAPSPPTANPLYLPHMLRELL